MVDYQRIDIPIRPFSKDTIDMAIPWYDYALVLVWMIGLAEPFVAQPGTLWQVALIVGPGDKQNRQIKTLQVG
jgi:hypothetical protein